VITTAAAIMVTVFLSFVLSDQNAVKMLAIGMAVAVLIDASIVRMILVPAVMALLGAHAWWMPRWLEPVLPRLHLEGSEAASAAPGAEALAGAAPGSGSRAGPGGPARPAGPAGSAGRRGDAA
jgi:RND superfamily putative drug exporter